MLRLLIIDDDPSDRLLIRRELSREFTNLQIDEIIHPEDLSQVLSAGNFHLVITDYQLRWNDGLTVLREIKARYPDCPVIMFTDSGSQEIAVEAMKAGLEDYVIKSPKQYVRLPLAVRSALQRAESQRKVGRLEMRLQTLLNRLNVGVFRSRLDGTLLEGNPSFLRLLGVNSLEEAQTLNCPALFLQSEAELQRLSPEREVQLHRADGSSIWVCLHQTLNTTEIEPVIEGLIEDITDRKLAHEALEQRQEELEIRVAERTESLQEANEQLLKEIQERKQAQERVRDREELYRQLVELCPDAIFIQRDGNFVFINNATVKLYGAKSKDELIGKPVLDTVHPDEREIVKERMRKLSQEWKAAEWRETKAVRLDGTVIDVEVAGFPFIYQQRAAAQIIVRDISDRKRVEEELRKTLEKERELSELKSRIINTISHEYRTPLTTIISSAELLEAYSDRLSQERKLLHLQRIQASGKHLTDLVSEALFIGQAELDKVKFSPAPLDVEQFCRELIEEVCYPSHNQLVLGATNISASIAFSIQGHCTNTYLDEKLLRQILTNLLSNALKYSSVRGSESAERSPASTVRFELECEQEVVRFIIQDDGIGIPAEDVPQLFDSFHRGGNVGTIPGTGLGLAIVKKCVDLHKGQITVESVLDVGTTFTVTLPCELPTPTR